MTRTATKTTRTTEAYLELLRRFPLRPIRSEDALDKAIEVVNDLSIRPHLSQDEDDYLDVLSTLIEAYEDEHYPIPPATDSAMLAHLIEARGITQAEFARRAEIAISTISEVISGKRRLTREHIDRISRAFNTPPDIFINPSRDPVSREFATA